MTLPDAPPHRLTTRATLATAGGLMLFLVLTLVVSALLVALPLAQRASDDLAALMITTAEYWSSLPPSEREAFGADVAREHGLHIDGAGARPPQALQPDVPYLGYLLNAFERRLDAPAALLVRTTEPGRYWIELPVGEERVRIGFDRERIGTHPLTAVLLALLIGAGASVVIGLGLGRWLNRPLTHLATAAGQLGEAHAPQRLVERGPEEVRAVIRAFNHMSARVGELINNRTTLLAGISHDLRTPLTRMRLALEMLGPQADPELLQQIDRDLDAMEQLIRQFMDFARGVRPDNTAGLVDVEPLIRQWLSEAALGGDDIRYHHDGGRCHHHIGRTALKRVFANLVENAQRYGDGSPVEVRVSCEAQGTSIHVMDRGPGIPDNELENVFQPFYRLENSRSGTTGGSGLGLAISKEICQAHGWQLRLGPREQGGTQATIHLPHNGGAARQGSQPA